MFAIRIKESYDKVPYTSAVSRLTNAMVCIKQDIFCSCNVSRFQSNLRLAHWQAIERIVGIFVGPQLCVILCGGKLHLIGHSDTN